MSYIKKRINHFIYLLFGICIFSPLLLLLVLICVVKQVFVYIVDWLSILVDWYEEGMKRRVNKDFLK